MKLFDEATEFEKLLKQWMLDHAPGHWLCIDEEHRLVDWQVKLSNRLGYYRPRKVLGDDFSFLLPDYLRAAHPAMVKKFFADSQPRTLASRAGRPFQLVRADGQLLDCVVSLFAFDATFCDGMCLRAYPEQRELAMAHILFLDDFGTFGDDVKLAAKVRSRGLIEAVRGLIQSHESATAWDVDDER